MTMMLVSNLAAPTPEQLVAVRRLMIHALVNRGFPYEDGEDVVQDVLEKIARQPGRFASKLADLDRHGPYFATAALNAYRMRLRSEGRRRRRQERSWQADSGGGADPGAAITGLDGGDALALADDAALTARQRRYLHYVFVDHLSIEEIAALTDTTPRAVRALLARTGAILRQRHLRTAAA